MPSITPLRLISHFPECFNILTLTSPSLLGPSAGRLGAHVLPGLGAEDGGSCPLCTALLPAATELPDPPVSWAPILWWALHEGCIKYYHTVPCFGPLKTLFLKALVSTGSSLELVLSLLVTPSIIYCILQILITVFFYIQRKLNSTQTFAV